MSDSVRALMNNRSLTQVIVAPAHKYEGSEAFN